MIAMASTKGGPGKTLLAQLLVGWSARQGLKVGVVDADPTGSLSRWVGNTYEGPPIWISHHETDAKRLAALLDGLSEAGEAEVVVVDTGGFGNKAATVAMALADLVLIPMSPGEADATEAGNTARTVAHMSKEAGREVMMRVVLNRMKATSLARHAAEVVTPLPRLAAQLSDLTAFGEMGFTGRVPHTGKAAVEIAALMGELVGMGLLPSTRRHTQDAIRKAQDA